MSWPRATPLARYHNALGRQRRALQRRHGVRMTIYIGMKRDRPRSKLVEDLGFGAGRIVCLECAGSGWWDYMEPEIPGFPCIDCKGTGYQLVSI